VVWVVGTPVLALVTSRLGLIELSSSRGLGLRIGTVKCRFLLGRNETEVKATTEAHLTLTSVDTMDTQKRKLNEYDLDEYDLVMLMRNDSISIVDAIAMRLPDVFAAEILTKLDIADTLNLAQVNKTYRDSVWSVGGVRSLEAKLKAHVNRTTEPIIQAASHGNVPAVRALLESGVDVNKNTLTGHTYRDSDNVYYTTALHVAAKNGHVATVKLLIENGADLNTRQESSLSVAAERGNSLCAIELIKAGADVNLASSSGATPLMIAASKGREAIVALLIGFGADVSLCNCRGETALDFLDEAFEEFDGGVDRNYHAACIPIQESLHGVVALLMGTDHARHYNPTKCTWTYPEQCHHV
jgi:hypothetical protein